MDTTPQPDRGEPSVGPTPDGVTVDLFGELWGAVFNTYYDAFYNEVLADKLIGLWQIFDDTSKIVIAASASSSAIAGWALWNQPRYRLVWSLVAAMSAVVGITDTSLGVAHRLKNWGEIKRSFATIRIETETLMYRMRFDADATPAQFQRAFIASRRKYLRAVQRLGNDILIRRWIQVAAQRTVNLHLRRETKGA